MKTPAHIKIAAVAVLLVIAVQADIYVPQQRWLPLGPPWEWKSGATTVTISHDWTLRVSGKGAMGDHWGSYDFPPWHDVGSFITGLVIDAGVIHIGNRAFAGLSELKSVTIPRSVKTIGDEAFRGCAGLESVMIPRSVKTIGDGAFQGCAGLKYVMIPRSVISIKSSAFYGCANLASIMVAANNAHYSCEDNVLFNKNKSALIWYPQGRPGASYTIPGSVKLIEEWAFIECAGLTSITIPNSVTAIEPAAFWGCSGLTSVTIPGSVTVIGNSAFNKCARLASVMIEDGVKTIGANAFFECANLTSVIIPSSVTTIESGVFYDCTGLKSVTFPNSVAAIGSEVFGSEVFGGYRVGLTSIIVQNPTPPQIKIGTHGTFNDLDRNRVCLYVPASSINSYRAAEGWKDFKCVKDLASAPEGE